MKKIFFLLLLIIQLNAFSLPFGVKGGFNYTIPQAKDYGYEDYTGAWGYDIGLFIMTPTVYNFYINIELFYDKFKFNGDDLFDVSAPGSLECKSIMGVFSIMYNSFEKHFVSIGIFGTHPIEYIETFRDKTYTRKPFPSYGLLAGYSYQYNKNIIFDLRYMYNKSSLIDFKEETKKEPCHSEWNEDIACHMDKFHHIQFLIGYKF